MSNQTGAKDEPKRAIKIRIIAIIGVLFIIGILVVNYFLLVNMDKDRGSYGDMFGLANAVFSGLAFLGIIVTILMQSDELTLQRRELELTRQELELTRSELTRTATAQEESQKALDRQANNLKISAEITALNGIIRHCMDVREHWHHNREAPQYQNATNEMNHCIARLRDIVQTKHG
jgi:hypothetical protein